MRFVNEWREGKTTIKQAMSKHDEQPATTEADTEKRFLDKVENELGLPDYSLFSAFAFVDLANAEPITPRW